MKEVYFCMNGIQPTKPDGPPKRSMPGYYKVIMAAAAILSVAAVAVILATAITDQASSTSSAPVKARNFTLSALGDSGSEVALAAYAGRPVIINFFASWCHPCQIETPLLARFYRSHHGKILLIGIDSSDERAPALKFLKAKRVEYPVGFDPLPSSVALSYGVVALPQTFFLSARHLVVRHVVGAVTLAELNAWAKSLRLKR